MKLEVVDHCPAAWFLLRGDNGEDGVYLDVACDQGAVGFSLLIRLTAEESEEHRALGRVFVDYLATKVACWPSRYRDRDLTPALGPEVSAAVARFRAGA